MTEVESIIENVVLKNKAGDTITFELPELHQLKLQLDLIFNFTPKLIIHPIPSPIIADVNTTL